MLRLRDEDRFALLISPLGMTNVAHSDYLTPRRQGRLSDRFASARIAPAYSMVSKK